MSNTPNLALPYILSAQAQKHVTHNEAIRALDALVQLSIRDFSHSAPPSNPQEGDRFIVAAPATGVWTNRENAIAAWQDDAWAFFSPQNGWLAFNQSEQSILVFSDNEWTQINGNSDQVVQFGVNTSPDSTNRLAVKSDSILFSYDDVAPGSGDMRYFINKATANNTASQLYQTEYSARAETGLTGSDQFQIKVSPDGTNWHEALLIDNQSGAVTLPNTAATSFPVPSRGNDSQIGFSSHERGQETSANIMSTAWMIVYPVLINIDTTIKDIFFNVFAAGANEEIGLALYASAKDHAPGDLIANFGSADCSTTGLKTLSLTTPMTVAAGLYWIAALPSAGTARTRGNAFTRDIGVGIIASNQLIRSGGTFRVHRSTHSISFWNPPQTLSNLETRTGQLDPSSLHCPAVLLK